MSQNLLFEQKLYFSKLCFWVCFAVSSSIHLHKVWPMDPWIPSSKWDFLLISYLASSNFIYILISSNLQNSNPHFSVKRVAWLSSKLRDLSWTQNSHLRETSFFPKKCSTFRFLLPMQTFLWQKRWLCLNNQLFLTSSTIKIDDIDKNHAMLWELCYSFYLMDGILVCQAIPYFSALISSETMDIPDH